jgi:hypothetical protein
MTTTDEHTRGWALAPARLAREDVKTLRKLYTEAHSILPPWLTDSTATARLHVDREDERKLALAKLGREAPHVRVLVLITENTITADVTAVVDHPTGTHVATHKFRRGTHPKEWTRILGRHCRHALGVLAHLRIRTLAEVFSSVESY